MMKKEEFLKELSEVEAKNRELEAKIRELNSEKDKIQKDLDDYSMNYAKQQQFFSMMFDFMKPNLDRLIDSKLEAFSKIVDNKIEEAFDNEHKSQYLSEIGLEA